MIGVSDVEDISMPSYLSRPDITLITSKGPTQIRTMNDNDLIIISVRSILGVLTAHFVGS